MLAESNESSDVISSDVTCRELKTRVKSETHLRSPGVASSSP